MLNFWDWENIDIELLKGKTITHIKGGQGDDELIFTLSTGEELKMYHVQDCCEAVWLEDVVGDLDDLIGSPLLVANEKTNREDEPSDDSHESYTWTYYNLATNKGHVTLRWFGTSNGWYSEDVFLSRIK